MRLSAAFVLALFFLLPEASAASSRVSFEGPSTIDAETPTTVMLAVGLALEGIVCAKDAEIPVVLHVVETSRVAQAVLSWDRVIFRVTSEQAAGAWRGALPAELKVTGVAPDGRVWLRAFYELPEHCVAPTATTGTADLAMDVRGPPLLTFTPDLPYEAEAAAAGSAPPRVPIAGALLTVVVGASAVFLQRRKR